MTIYIVTRLRTLTELWRQTAEQTRIASDTNKDVVLQGHLQGVSDGLMIASNDVNKLLAKPDGDHPR